ncbi:hypothetical protein JX266_013404 [Neoarthrinium moseri]|nr:hypothetical protein JX266_013404 [Neoarthrinium moseri]
MLQGLSVDAFAIYRSDSAEFSDTRSNAIVAKFLSTYRDQRDSNQDFIAAEKPSEDEAVAMIYFFFSIRKSLVGYYARWAKAKLADEAGGSVCRRASGPACIVPLPAVLSTSLDIWGTFLYLFPPWEVEEVSCIYTFAEMEYGHIFDSIRWDVHETNPKFDGQRPPTPDGAFGLDNSCPPLAWTIIWRGTYSNLFGHYVDDDLRCWGYIMWDAKTLGRTGATKVLARQWQKRWGGTDPRNRVY